MSSLVLLLCGLVGPDTGVTPTAGDLAAYEAAKASVGRDAESQVKLALWCEAHGVQAERAKHLVRAVLSDPKNALARGLLGLVAYGGRWELPEAVAAKVKADAQLAARLAEYNARWHGLEYARGF